MNIKLLNYICKFVYYNRFLPTVTVTIPALQVCNGHATVIVHRFELGVYMNSCHRHRPDVRWRRAPGYPRPLAQPLGAGGPGSPKIWTDPLTFYIVF